MNLEIRQVDLAEVIAAMRLIPEFEPPRDTEYYQQKIKDKDHLVLMAYDGAQIAGFKVGYDKYEDGSFYSWIGAVMPAYRQKGVASLLAEEQEQYTRTHQYQSIRMKTRNKFRAMLIFSLKRGFQIIELEERSELPEYRIHLIKKLSARRIG